ncbi:MAG: prepilin peptidase [Proteobacteria bacterium]|nr:prepilin peptidase [Pseudomonadota bacterium]
MPPFESVPPILVWTIIFIFGILWGSFFNVCIVRLPEEKSVLWGRSNCPKCQALIPWFCNIPIFSFIFLRGKCLNCKAAISFEYPLVETFSGFMFLGLFLYFGWSKEFIANLILCSGLLVISVIDLHHQIIPDEISLPGIVIGFLVSLWVGKISWWQSLLGILIGGGIFLAIAWGYEKISKKEGLGGGDIKLLAMLGAWLGVQSLLVIIIMSSLLGSIVGISLMIFQKKDFKTAIPFGPFLALGALAYLFFGEQLQTILFPNLNP